jgi:hypothetical protein
MSNSRFIPVEGHPGLVRDSYTMAILNINTEEVRKKRMQRLAAQKQAKEIEVLKNDVGEIKSLLKQLLEKSKDG